MGLKADVSSSVSTILTATWNERTGSIVPTTDTVALSNGLVQVSAVWLYADLADSTGLAKNHPRATTAKVIRAYLSAVTRVLLKHGGEIRSFDGDRVMAIFMGGSKESIAAQSALEIKWLIDNVVQPAVYRQFKSIRDSGWVMTNGTGIDTGQAAIVRGGVRSNSDLVSVGNAPNIAAKLSERRTYRTYITTAMWNAMSSATCFSSDGRPMWSNPFDVTFGSRTVAVRGSDWGWIVN